MISTARRVEYAHGYIALGLLDEASDELAAIAKGDCLRPDVVAAWVELSMAAKHWAHVVEFARQLTELDPENSQGWIAWAYALRERQEIEAALAVLQQVEQTHGRKQAVIPYNLACYHCLLGDTARAKTYLRKACKMDASFKAAALEDPDLKAMRGEIG